MLPQHRRVHAHRILVPSVVAAVLLVSGTAGPVHLQAPPTFASRVAQLSEREGHFDADDNLITNERSYLHPMSSLRDARVTGGAYLGVGPDQNFSYIAQVRPSIAFVIDIRRDNLLLHLLFKALFSLAPTRIEYVSLLFGRPVPAPVDEWRQADIGALARFIDGSRPTVAATAALRTRVDAAIRSFGVPLTAADYATIGRFHRKFMTDGLGLKYETSNTVPAGFYPTYRQLLLETDRAGRQSNFLNAEGDFQFVRSLEQRDLVIPVVGDLGGATALNAIARLMASRGNKVSAFYVSNVEYYLSNDGKLQDFLNNLGRLPYSDQSLLIRSVFGGYILPQTVQGYRSTSLVQPIHELLEGFSTGRFRSYNDLLLSR